MVDTTSFIVTKFHYDVKLVVHFDAHGETREISLVAFGSTAKKLLGKKAKKLQHALPSVSSHQKINYISYMITIKVEIQPCSYLIYIIRNSRI